MHSYVNSLPSLLLFDGSQREDPASPTLTQKETAGLRMRNLKQKTHVLGVYFTPFFYVMILTVDEWVAYVEFTHYFRIRWLPAIIMYILYGFHRLYLPLDKITFFSAGC